MESSGTFCFMYSELFACAVMKASVQAADTSSCPFATSSGLTSTLIGFCCAVRITLTAPSRTVVSISVFSSSLCSSFATDANDWAFFTASMIFPSPAFVSALRRRFHRFTVTYRQVHPADSSAYYPPSFELVRMYYELVHPVSKATRYLLRMRPL